MVNISKVPSTTEQCIIPNEEAVNVAYMTDAVMGYGSNRLNNILVLIVKCQGSVKPIKFIPILIPKEYPLSRLFSEPKKRKSMNSASVIRRRQIYAKSIVAFVVLYFQKRMMAIHADQLAREKSFFHKSVAV